MNVPPIASRRLDLVSMSLDFMRASLDRDRARAATLIGATVQPGWPSAPAAPIDASLPDDWPSESAARTLRRRVRQLEADPTEQPWLLRAMLTHAAPRRLVGRIGFHAPPDARGALEIGYAVEPGHRRRGYATEALAAMLAWAEREHAIDYFIASVSPTNVPSLALVRRFGFAQTGTQWDDEDGEELVFELHR